MKRPLALLAILSVQALAAFLWTVFTPSESGHGVFLWLSTQRLLLSALAVGVFLSLLAVTLYAWRSKTALQDVLQTLDRWCIDEGRLGALLLPLVLVPLAALAAVWQVLRTPLLYAAYQDWAPETFPFLRAVTTALLPLLCLTLLISLETAAYLASRYRGPLTSAKSWSWRRLSAALIPLIIALAVAFHWIVLAFQLRTFVNIPAWYWKIEPIPLSARDAFFGIGFLILFALACAALLLLRRPAIGLVLVACLAWYLQMGVGIMSDGGFKALRERYFSTYHKAYVTRAAQSDVTIVESIQRYEELFAVHAFTSTKPPGLMAFYIGLDHLVNGYPSAFSDEIRTERLSQVVTYGFPVLALLMVPLLFAFARRLSDSSSLIVPSVAPMLFVLAPSAVLFSLFPDQAIYPTVFLLGIWLTIIIIDRQSLIWAFVLGAVLYLCVFFAFTMLPLYPFAGLYLILRCALGSGRESGTPWRDAIRLAIAIGLGTLVLYGLFVVFLNYNFLPRFERTMSINHNFDFYLRVGQPPPSAPETLGTRLGQIVNAAGINNLDFAAGIGFPIYILFAVQAIRRVGRLFKERLGGGDIILMGLLLSFVVLNLLGTAQGEVPRLWLFWLPMVAVFAAYELEPHAKKHPWVIFWLGLAQFITIVLTYHFQDLRM